MEDDKTNQQQEQAQAEPDETAQQTPAQTEGAPEGAEQAQEQPEQQPAEPAKKQQPPTPKRDEKRETEQARIAHQAEVEKARQEARVQAIVDAVGTNPWTGKAIENAADVDEYLLMRHIEGEGKDPIADYPEYVKRQKAEQERATAKAQSDRESARKQIEEFKTAYPDVDLQELAKDTDFDDFARGKIGNEPLADIYGQYLAFRERVTGDAAKKAQQREVAAKAKANAAVGSLSNESDQQQSEYFTLEQMQAMSASEIDKNWDKVQKSLKRLN